LIKFKAAQTKVNDYTIITMVDLTGLNKIDQDKLKEKLKSLPSKKVGPFKYVIDGRHEIETDKDLPYPEEMHLVEYTWDEGNKFVPALYKEE
jgi:hypothetical protein